MLSTLPPVGVGDGFCTFGFGAGFPFFFPVFPGVVDHLATSLSTFSFVAFGSIFLPIPEIFVLLSSNYCREYIAFGYKIWYN